MARLVASALLAAPGAWVSPTLGADGVAENDKIIDVKVDTSGPAREISPNLIGIFFEDLNYAADGGLYAELVQNRSFEYTPQDNPGFTPLSNWEMTAKDRAKATLTVESADPLNANNTHYGLIDVESPGTVSVTNTGFGGIAVKGGERYDFSVFAKHLTDGIDLAGVQLESAAGEVIADAPLPATSDKWDKLKVTLDAKTDAADARLVLTVRGKGKLAIDMVSLFPQKTFRGHANGLRNDLAQTIAELQPKFMRFPGGCLVHGRNVDNIYRWKETIGPVEQRKDKSNLWGYHQSYGMGFYEYFQFCEDIGAMPLPVVAAGVTCQNGGQKSVPMADMPAYTQDILDLIEWANGPATSQWGAKRAEAGHPAPFNLKYLAVGNEDAITPAFRERFTMIYEAIKAKHPEIVIIGTVGPAASGRDFDDGWALADELGVDMVDEHYYCPPAWFLQNNDFYDHHKPGKTAVYLGEYAAHDFGQRTTLRSALAEAAYLTGVERNGDFVRFASYAPLLGKYGNSQWNPNLIYFNNQRVVPTASYQVQQLFSTNGGDQCLTTKVTQGEPETRYSSNLFVGTWDTHAEFEKVRVTRGSEVVFSDDFAGESKGWSPEQGQWSIGTGVYQQTGDAQPAVSRIERSPGDGDYVFSLRARKTGGNEGFLVGFNGLDASNYYWWNLGGWGNSRHAIEKSTNSVKQEVGPSVPGQIELNRWYDIRIEVANHRVRCLLDGKLVREFTDDGYKAWQRVYASTVRDSSTGDVIVKVVNVGEEAKIIQLELDGDLKLNPEAVKTVLTGKPLAMNTLEDPQAVKPVTSSTTIAPVTKLDLPAYSFTILRMKALKAQ